MQNRIEILLKSQAHIRACYHSGDIDDAIAEFHATIAPAMHAVDPRISRCANRLARSFVQMVDDDPDVIAYLATRGHRPSPQTEK